MSDIRYAVYLLPSYEMGRAQAEVHDALLRRYGVRAAGMFMPHATIKGFFRSKVNQQELVSLLDASLNGREVFEVFNGGVTAFGRDAIVIDVNHTPEGAPNIPLRNLHKAVVDKVTPVVDPRCEFTREEKQWAHERFRAHLTLAMKDIPGLLFDEVLGFVRRVEPIGPPVFFAENIQLFSFCSDDWTGRWWETLRWRSLHSWDLAAR